MPGTKGADRVEETVHGSAVAVGERGLLITGKAGAGKTSLALELIAFGAELVGDDRVHVARDSGGGLTLTAPRNIAGMIEVRGFGLARLAARPSATLSLIADLDLAETDRLPERHERMLLGVACPVVLCKGRPGLASALTCLLRAAEWPAPDHFAGR